MDNTNSLNSTALLPLVFDEDLGKPHIEQLNFWEKVQPVFTRVERFFKGVDSKRAKEYSKYLADIQPQNSYDHFLRWIFAFLSVHTTWQANVIAYNLLKDGAWIGDNEELERRLIKSRAGLHKNRTKYISTFTEDFWKRPSLYIPNKLNTKEQRNALYKKLLGLGIAKTSFAIEMCLPIDSEAVCMDTHLFQIYGLSQNKHANLYLDIENHWNRMCRLFDVTNYIARCLFWDTNQGKEDSRYWSYCLEQ
jgi:thermostable 8-oxoguanine DNA glycosylase